MSDMVVKKGTIKIRSEIGQSLLAVAYLRMEQEGFLPMVFWDKVLDLREFLDWCAKPNMVVAGCFVETPGPTLDAPPVIQLAGLGWIYNIKDRNGCRYADVGEVFWREYQSMGVTFDLVKALYQFAFGPCKITALYGITPEKNIAAVRFMKRCGFQAYGPVPGLCCWYGEECGGWLSVLTRDAWVEKFSAEAAHQDDPPPTLCVVGG